MRLHSRVDLVAFLSAAVLFVLALTHCVDDGASPALLVDGGVVVEEGSTALYAVTGTVSGLSASDTVTLTLNAGSPLSVGDGAFAFPALLTQGQTYAVAVASAAKGFACTVSQGTGTIAMSPATGVLVQCSSTASSLSALTVSAAPLTPAFSATTLAYKANARVSGIFPPQTTTTVTATAIDPNATITVNGVPTKSGVPSAPVTLKANANAIDVTVTAADGKTKSQYAIALSGYVNDYLKTSVSLPMNPDGFGSATALSTDGNTLAVGAPDESSNATGINGNQNDVSKQSAGAVYVFARTNGTWAQQAYIKASNTRAQALFGRVLALSGDGNTLAVGAADPSNATGINGSQTDASAVGAGAVYVFTRAATTWSQEAFIKASNTSANGNFGCSIALSNDGNTLAVGAGGDASNATGINGNDADTSATLSGAVFVFTRAGTTWSEQAYVKASNNRAQAGFRNVALSSDGNTLAVGAASETSNATGINGNQSDTSLTNAGAVYVFTRAGVTWSQAAYIKASNTAMAQGFGIAVSLSSDGTTLAVGAAGESSASKGVNSDQSDISAPGSGAAYVFAFATGEWSQQAYVKASNTFKGTGFGATLSISNDGNTLLSGAYYEKSAATGINGNQADTSTYGAGAAYVLTRSGTTWSQLAYVKASNTQPNEFFGSALAISGDGKTVAVGAYDDESDATGINGNQSDQSDEAAGAVFVF